MQIIYIEHSGYVAEWEDVICAFDCVSGVLPPLNPEKKIFVFFSHCHPDHFSTEAFEKFASYPTRQFFLSDDIPISPEENKQRRVFRLKPEMSRVVRGGKKGAFSVFALDSTDAGVAFVVTYAGRTVFHAGDLNQWVWPEDSNSHKRRMHRRFSKAVMRLRGVSLDAVFFPVDPRLEENAWLGADGLLRTLEVGHFFPMHMWGDYTVVDRFLADKASEPYRDKIVRVTTPGQRFII